MMGTAHSSPRLRGASDWYEAMKRPSVSASMRPSPCAMACIDSSYTRGNPADGPEASEGNCRL